MVCLIIRELTDAGTKGIFVSKAAFLCQARPFCVATANHSAKECYFQSMIKFCETRQIWGIWKLRPAYSPETPNLGQNRWCFVPCDLEIWWMTLENNRASLLCCFKLCATFHSHWWIQTGVTVRKRPNLGQIRRFLEPCDLAIWSMTLKNNRAPLLCYFKLYASFRSHQWIQAGVTVRKRPIWVKINDFFSRVTLQSDVWPCKTIGHLFYAISSFVHHFVAIGDFKLELQSGNTQFGSNSTILRAVWPCNLTYDLEKQ